MPLSRTFYDCDRLCAAQDSAETVSALSRTTLVLKSVIKVLPKKGEIFRDFLEVWKKNLSGLATHSFLCTFQKADESRKQLKLIV